MGSAEFATMVAALLGMSQGITLLLAKSLLVFFDYKRPYYSEYAVGFSGVLFAMKVVLNSQSENYTAVHGILIVPSRYAAWAELILIQLLVPGVSFLGHLGGILAGILYLRLKGTYSGSDPLTALFRGLTSALSWPLRIVRKMFRSPTRRISGRGTSGESRRGSSVSGGWRCQACTYENIGSTSMCWTCGSNRKGDGFSPRRLHRSHDLPLEELRRRRIDRFERDDVFVRQHMSPSSPRSPIGRILSKRSLSPIRK